MRRAGLKWPLCPTFAPNLLMLYSMTGFGRAETTVEGYNLVAEIRSLNGKGFDLSLRMPQSLRALEPHIRTLVGQKLSRGTIELSVSLRTGGSSRPMQVNQELAVHYYKSIQELAGRLSLPVENMLQTLLGLPDVVAPETENLPESVTDAVLAQIETACDALMQHRLAEGAVLEADLETRIGAIEVAQGETAPYEAPRTERVRQKLTAALEAIAGAAEKIDANRLEQELIYYLEKLDFTEEKTRLAQHCRYFRELLADDSEKSKGKKLGFVLQEVGREINTMGSKASDATIQKIVVGMKDELEKAKEQVLNVL